MASPRVNRRFRKNAKPRGRMQMNRVTRIAMGTLILLALGGASIAHAQQSDMTFFVTSAGSGKGADLGGLAGADKQCQALAQSAGAGGKTWHADPRTQRSHALQRRGRPRARPMQ